MRRTRGPVDQYPGFQVVAIARCVRFVWMVWRVIPASRSIDRFTTHPPTNAPRSARNRSPPTHFLSGRHNLRLLDAPLPSLRGLTSRQRGWRPDRLPTHCAACTRAIQAATSRRSGSLRAPYSGSHAVMAKKTDRELLKKESASNRVRLTSPPGAARHDCSHCRRTPSTPSPEQAATIRPLSMDASTRPDRRW